jgi:hypothetical protein
MYEWYEVNVNKIKNNLLIHTLGYVKNECSQSNDILWILPLKSSGSLLILKVAYQWISPKNIMFDSLTYHKVILDGIG